MRRAAALAVPLLLAPLLLLAGCGGDEKSDSSLPTVTGKFGEKPTVTLPKHDPGKTLEARTVIQGSGAVVKKGQLLVAHYLGETWRDAHVFDESYGKKAAAGFPIGVGKVVPGWDEKLVGVKAGSRVLLSIPPEKGYGAQGQPSAGIKGDDTLVFVVDVLGSYDPASAATGAVTAQDGSGTLPAVQGKPGQKPAVTVPKGTAPPKQLVVKTLVQGTGPAVAKGQTVVQQYLAATWSTGKQLDATWARPGGPMPVALPVGTGQLPAGWEEALVGAKVGSRVLAVIPPDKGFGKAGNPDVGLKPNETLVFVFDVLGAY